MGRFCCVLTILALRLAAATPEELFRAIRADDLATLQRWAADAAAVHQADAKGTTALHYAALAGSTAAVRLLLSAGARVDARNVMDATPLILAASSPAKVQLLVAAKANIQARTKSGRTALLIAAGRPGGSATVRLLLDQGAALDEADERGVTPLMEAADGGDLETVQLLLARGANARAADKGGLTALHLAMESNSIPIARLLLRHGADVNAANQYRNTVKNGKIALTRMTPLIYAAPHGSVELIRLLLSAGAQVNVQDDRGLTPLLAAVATDHQDLAVIQALLAAGADVNAKDHNGESVLDWAAKTGHPPVLQALAKAGAQRRLPAVPVDAPPRRTPPPGVEAAVQSAAALLVRSSEEFFRQSGCVGCHHQPAAAQALRAVAQAGLAIPVRVESLQQAAMTAVRAREANMVLFGPIGGRTHAVADEVQGFFAGKVPANSYTDAALHYIASNQDADGGWTRCGIARPPLEESGITSTALAVRALRVYGWPARQPEFDARIARARAWLLRAEPRTNYEQSDRLLGLTWAGASKAELAKAAAPVRRAQRPDGGWAQNRYLASDAYATGLALHALHASGQARPDEPAYRRGVEYLRQTQLADGSWHVRSRAPKFQPYFQSGFPHDHDQWISAAATALAVQALAPAAQPQPAVARGR